MSREYLTIALPKGKLFEEGIDLFKKVGLQGNGLDTDSRKLIFDDVLDRVKYIICRPTDIPTYVEYGAADLGVVGKDTIVEQGKDVYELVDLKFGFCKFVVAVPQSRVGNGSLSQFNHGRVATKFPRVAEKFFAEQGMQVEIIKLHGNIELAPIVGLSEMIVDIVSTGRTLKENNLVAIADIMTATARLIANRASYKLKGARIQPLVDGLKQLLGNGQGR